MPRAGVQNFTASITFNGISGYLSASNPSNITFGSGARSIAFWCKRGSLTSPSGGGGGDSGVFSNNFNYGSNLGWCVHYDSNGTVSMIMGNAYLSSGTGAFPINTWVHVVGTYDSSGNVIIYKNGANVSAPGSHSIGTEVITSTNIGTESGTFKAFSGLLLDVRVYNRALTGTEALQLALGYDITNGLVEEWRLQDGSGTTAQARLTTSSMSFNGGVAWSTDVPSLSRGLAATRSSTYTRTNLFTNPSFETGTSSWSSTQSSTYSFFGSYSGQNSCTFTSGSRGSQPYLNSQNVFTPTIGLTYTFSIYVYIPTGSPLININIGIRDWTTYNYISSLTHQYNLTAGQWTRMYDTITATDAHPQVRFIVADPNAPGFTGTANWYNDGALLEASSQVNGYFDGSTNGGNWTGSANASTSILTVQPIQRVAASGRTSAT